MPKLPILSGKDVVKKLERVGYLVARQKGSHLRLLNDINKDSKPITVPLHKEIKPGLLKQIIKDSGLSVDEFIKI